MRKLRTIQVSTRLTKEEEALLVRMAEKRGLKPSTMIRYILLDFANREKEPLPPPRKELPPSSKGT